MKKIMLSLLAVSLICGCTINSNVKQGNLEGVKTYVEKGRDLNVQAEPYGHTPLYVATYYGHKEIAAYLLEHGADVNARALDGTTPLMCTAMYNFPELTQMLIAAGADPDIKDNKGHTALYYANQYRFFKVAECLQSAGAVSE